jgi:DNA-binding NarL/FixJ family response regulator
MKARTNRINEQVPVAQVKATGPAAGIDGKARVLIVDDHPIVRDGFSNLVKRQRDLARCGEAATVAETFAAVETLQPDLVLLDLWIGGGDGLDLIKSLKARFPQLRILVISFSDEAVYAARALRAGARGYVMKSQSSKEILTAIRTVLTGELYVSPAVANSMLSSSVGQSRSKADKTAEVLTDRELQILQLLGSGQSTRKIAELLSLSFKTIEAHRDNIKRKLGLQDAVELVHYATTWSQEQRPHLSANDLLPSRELRN